MWKGYHKFQYTATSGQTKWENFLPFFGQRVGANHLILYYLQDHLLKNITGQQKTNWLGLGVRYK